MLNIQFMTEEQSKMVKGIYGDKIKMYFPDWEALMANASCEEERDAIIEIAERDKKYIAEGKEFLAGFAFPVVHTIKADMQEWVKDEKGRLNCNEVCKWTVYQHPWWECEGVRCSEEEIIAAIERMMEERG